MKSFKIYIKEALIKKHAKNNIQHINYKIIRRKIGTSIANGNDYIEFYTNWVDAPDDISEKVFSKPGAQFHIHAEWDTKMNHKKDPSTGAGVFYSFSFKHPDEPQMKHFSGEYINELYKRLIEDNGNTEKIFIDEFKKLYKKLKK